jgi:polar amino acid transport system substrate-binding protein
MLKFICADLDARPLFWTEDNKRFGFEPEVAQAIAKEMGEELQWVFLKWADFSAYLLSGKADAIMCGSAITPEREKQFLYSKPYAYFNESVLIRSEDHFEKPEDFQGKILGAIHESTNMALAQQWKGCQYRAFDGTSDNVFKEMIDALSNGEIDGVVDDEPAFGGTIQDPKFKIAFTVETKNAWGIAMQKDNFLLKEKIDRALNSIYQNSMHQKIWNSNFNISYPGNLI